jgi:hypothetical protein
MTQTHTPTPISTRMARIATGQDWNDNTHYGDTDYGLYQEFERGKTRLSLKWGPDGRHGVADELLSVTVDSWALSPLSKTLFHIEGRSQDAMRAAAVESIYYYA